MARRRNEEEYYGYEDYQPQQNVNTLYPMQGNYCPPINVATPINIAPPAYYNPAPRYKEEDYCDYYEPRPRRRRQRYASGYAYSPVLRLNEHRGLAKMFFLGILTLGIYPFVALYRMSVDINIIASRYDGKRTMNYAMMAMLLIITLGIGYLVWESKFCARIKNELARRGIDYKFGAGSFWGWNTIGCLILIGPLIFIHKRCKAMNLLSEDYNING